MNGNSISKRRQEAETIFAEAQRAHAVGRLAWAVEHAREALRIDGSYTEVCHWLAERYLEVGATDRASHQYQLILRSNRDDEKAWNALEEIDPQGAARVKRLHEIPPDPFVRQRQARASEEFDSIEQVAADQPAKEEAAPFLRDEEAGDDFETLEQVSPQQEMAQVGGVFPQRDEENSDLLETLDEVTDEELGDTDEPWAGDFDEDQK